MIVLHTILNNTELSPRTLKINFDVLEKSPML